MCTNMTKSTICIRRSAGTNPGKHNFGSGEYQALKVSSVTDPIQVVIRNISVRNSSKYWE